MTDFTADIQGSARPDSRAMPPGAADVRLSDVARNPLRFLLLLRFAVVNIVALALFAAAWAQGWVEEVIRADGTGISVAIFFVFLGGLAICTQKIWRASCELNLAKDFNPHLSSKASRYLSEISGRDSGSRGITASSLKLKLSTRIAIVRHIANSLVLLGLIGTVVGFIIALAGVDADKASDVTSIAPMVSTLIEGMSVALYTTLVGGILNIWLMVNYNVLVTGTVNLVTEIVSLGERLSEGR